MSTSRKCLTPLGHDTDLMVPETITSWRIICCEASLQERLIRAFPQACLEARYDPEQVSEKVALFMENLQARCGTHNLKGINLAHCFFLSLLFQGSDTPSTKEPVLQRIFTLEGCALLSLPSEEGLYPADMLRSLLTPRGFERNTLALLLNGSPWGKVNPLSLTHFWRHVVVTRDIDLLTALTQHKAFQDDIQRERSDWTTHPFWIILGALIKNSPLRRSPSVPGARSLPDYMRLLTCHMKMEAFPDAFHGVWTTFEPHWRRLFLEKGFFEELGVHLRTVPKGGDPSLLVRALQTHDLALVHDAILAGFTWEEVPGGRAALLPLLREMERTAPLSLQEPGDCAWLSSVLCQFELERIMPPSDVEMAAGLPKRRRV